MRPRRPSTRAGVNAALTSAPDPGVIRRVGLGHADREVLVQRREEPGLPAGHPLDDLGHAIGARETARVADRELDVLRAGQEPAAPGLDPVDRRLLAEATEDRVGVGDEPGRSEQVIERGGDGGHGPKCSQPPPPRSDGRRSDPTLPERGRRAVVPRDSRRSRSRRTSRRRGARCCRSGSPAGGPAPSR